jgi:hypothetical protein
MTGWRRYALPVLLWVYGMSVTVTLISLWGRAVVVDTGLLATAAEDAAGAPLISRQLEAWLAGQLADVPVLDATVADDLATDLVADPALQTTLDALVGAVVTAAAAPDGEAEVDVAALLSPAVPPSPSVWQRVAFPSPKPWWRSTSPPSIRWLSGKRGRTRWWAADPVRPGRSPSPRLSACS